MTENNKATTTATAETITEEIITTVEQETDYNFEVIEDFKESLKGAERLMWKGVKLINRYANIHLNEWDKQDAISAVYVAVMTYEPTAESVPLPDLSQKYFGLQTREQFRAGYNALQKVVYGNRQQAKTHDYSQEYGLDGTHAKDDIAEVELDLTLQSILSEQFNRLLDLRLQGYSVTEIAEITGIAKRTVERYQAEIKTILKSAFNVDTEGRKIHKIKK